MKRKGIDWDAQPLGQESDGAIAARLGVSRPTVRRARLHRGIAAHTSPGGVRSEDMVPAGEKARANEWSKGTWINSSMRIRPRRITMVWGPRVHMCELRPTGRIQGVGKVQNFPIDVHSVDAPEGLR